MAFRYDEVKCPECGGDMKSRTGAYGVFWGCRAFPNCKGTRDSEGRSKADRAKESNKYRDAEEVLESKEVLNSLKDGIATYNERTKTSFNKR